MKDIFYVIINGKIYNKNQSINFNNIKWKMGTEKAWAIIRFNFLIWFGALAEGTWSYVYAHLVSSRPWSRPGLLPGLHIFGLGPLNLAVISRHSINIKPTHHVPRNAKGSGDSDGFSR